MALSTSVSLLLVATFCCFIVNAAEEKQFLPSVAHRQSKQMFHMPPSLFNYYNPYGSQIVAPTGQGRIYPELVSGDFESAVMGRVYDRNEIITITPGPRECLLIFAFKAGFSPCTKSSMASSGSIEIQLKTAQVALVTIAPQALRYSKVKVTCTVLTNVKVVMKSTILEENGVTEANEAKPTSMYLNMVDIAKPSTLKCSWTSS